MNIKNSLGKRAVSLALAAMLLASSLPLSAFSQDAAQSVQSSTAQSAQSSTAQSAQSDISQPAQTNAQPSEEDNASEAAKQANANLIDLLVENGLRVKLQLNNQDYVAGTPIARDSVLSVELSYELSNEAKRIIDSQTVIAYALPPEMKFSDLAEQTIENAGITIGRYSLQDNVLQFSYTEDFIESSNIKGFFRLDARLTQLAVGGGDETSFTFAGTNTPITITLEDSIIKGTKTYALNDDGTLSFTIELTVDAPSKDVTLTDTMGANFLYRANTLRATAPDGGGMTLDEPVFNKVEGTSDTQAVIPLGNLIAGVYTISYDVDTVESKAAKNPELNVVQWKWMARTEHTGSASCKVTGFGAQLAKDGSLDTTKKLVNWKVTVNGSLPFMNVSGQKVYDVLAGAHSLQGNLVIYRDTERDKGNNTIYATVPLENLETEEVGGVSKTVLYTFPEDAGSHRFYLYYSTGLSRVPASDGGSETYTNTVEIGSKKATKQVSWNIGSSTIQTASIRKDKGNPNYGNFGIDRWTQEITVNNGMKQGMIFTDWLISNASVSQDGKNPSVRIFSRHIPESLVIMFQPKGGSEKDRTLLVAGEDYSVPVYRKLTTTDGNKYCGTPNTFGDDTFTLTFLKDLQPGKILITSDTQTDWGSMPMQSSLQVRNYGEAAYLNAKGTYDRVNDYEHYDTFSAIEKAGSQAVWDETANGGKGGNVIGWTITANAIDKKHSYRNLGDKTLTVQDRLPEGLSYVEGSVKIVPFASNNVNLENIYKGYEKEPIVENVDGGGSILTWNFPKSSNQWYKITFKTLIDADFLNEQLGGNPENGVQITFKNETSMSVGGTPLGQATADSTYTHTLLSKTAKQVDGKSRAEYSIQVNTPSLQLNNGNPLTLKDIIPEECTLLMDTIQVKRQDTGAEIAKPDISYNGTTREFTIKLPDATAYTVLYTLLFDVADETQTDITIRNKATLNGVSITDAATENKFVLFKNSAGAKGEKGTYTLKKLDADSVTTALKGAEFKLYRVNLQASVPGAIQATEIDVQTTGADGIATFKKDGSGLLAFDELYYYQETKAPNGYIKDETPHYFMLPGNAYETGLKQAEQLVGEGNVEKHLGIAQLVTNQKMSTTAVMGGTKTLTNGIVQKEEFTFVLFHINSAGVPEQLQTVKNGAAGSDGVATFAFEPVRYTEAGTYEYLIKEQVNSAQTNVRFDETEYHVQVVVEEQRDANKNLTGLKATVDYGKAAPAFRNTKIVSVPIDGTKQLTGKTLAAGDYTFVMKDGAGNFMRMTNSKPDAQGKASFHFDTPPVESEGTYQYTIYEEPGAVDGVVYDKTIYNVTVTVDAAMNATTKITKQGETGEVQMPLAFHNTYTAVARIEGVKKLSGAPLAAGDYSFALYAADEKGLVTGEAIGTTENAANGSFIFTNANTKNALSFQEAGAFHYVVREVVPEDAAKKPGVAYDTQDHFVTVLVAQENGTLQATVSYPTQGLTVNNVYSTAAQIRGEKVMSGGIVPVAGAYQFALYAVNSAGEAEQTPLATAFNEADGSFAFVDDALTYRTTGEWHYQVREVMPTDAQGNVLTQKDGVIYDKTVYDVKVTVAKDNTGRLMATVDKTQTQLHFVNVVNAKAVISGTKTMNGTAPNPGAFTFELKDKSGTVLGTATNDAKGGFSFTSETTNDALSYAAPGEYTYTITEQNGGVPGVVYDKSSVAIKVSVKQDSKTGELTATVDKDATDVTFKNTGVVSAALRGTKKLLGSTMADGQFSFALYEAKGAELTTVEPQETALQTVVNQGATFAFKPITYTAAGEYYYIIQEVDGGATKGGIYYDNSAYVARVSVVEERDGTFTPTVNYYAKGSEKPLAAAPEFVNSSIQRYGARRAAPAIAGKKTVNGIENANITEGAFRFELYEGEALVATATNARNGNFSFPLSGKAPGTYQYTLKEQNGGQTIDGVVYDPTVYAITVIIEPDYSYRVLVNGAEGRIRFNNTEQTQITVNKTWDDANDAAGERPDSLAVTLLADEKEKDRQTLSADTNWSYTWGNLPIRNAAGKKIVYTVREDLAPNYTASITATEENNGTTYALVNSMQELAGAFIDPTITKKLNGAVLEEAQFEFGLYDSTDTLVSTATNRADGSVVFPSLNFTTPGTYRYSIREIPGSDVHVDYDTTAVGAIITVARDAASEGSLGATVEYLQDGKPTTAPTLTNRYNSIVLQVQKTSKDMSHSPLEGAVYGLYRVNEGGTRDVLVGKCESDFNGMMRFADIAVNQKYYFKEISAPAGHTVDGYATEVFWVTQDSATGAITILIEDASGNWVPTDAYSVSGALPTPMEEKNSVVTPENAVPAGQETAGKEEVIEPENTPMAASPTQTEPRLMADTAAKTLTSNGGSLNAMAAAVLDFLTEIGTKNAASIALAVSAPLGNGASAAAPEPAAEEAAPPADNASQGGVIITADGVSDAVTKLVVAKLDANTRAFVPGATLQIIEKSTGTTVFEWTTGSAAQTMSRALNVEVVYILREVSAPGGYQKAEDTEFVIGATGVLTVKSGANAEWVSDERINLYNTPITQTVVQTVYNEVVTQTQRIVNSPKTGDGAPIAAVLVFILAALLGILYLEHRRYLKNTRK